MHVSPHCDLNKCPRMYRPGRLQTTARGGGYRLANPIAGSNTLFTQPQYFLATMEKSGCFYVRKSKDLPLLCFMRAVLSPAAVTGPTPDGERNWRHSYRP